jgi:hypothetical protein
MPPMIVPVDVVSMPVAVLIPAMTVMTMTVMTMTVTGKCRWRHQQRGSRSGDQQEFANQGISSKSFPLLTNVTFDE